jgi:hypothetical protein
MIGKPRILAAIAAGNECCRHLHRRTRHVTRYGYFIFLSTLSASAILALAISFSGLSPGTGNNPVLHKIAAIFSPAVVPDQAQGCRH